MMQGGETGRRRQDTPLHSSSKDFPLSNQRTPRPVSE